MKMPPEDVFAIPLSDADIQEFIEIYKQEFKIELSAKEASKIASGVLELYRILIRPLPGEIPSKDATDGMRGGRPKSGGLQEV